MAKALKILKFSAIALLTVALIGYVVFAAITMSSPDPDEQCVAVELEVNKGAKVNFIDSKEIENILRNQHLYPKGKLMKNVDTRKIEQAVKTNSFVEGVECFKTNGGKLKISVTQREPVIYVIPDGSDGYYVDKNGFSIVSSFYSSNLPIATGSIDQKFASEHLAQLGLFLQTNTFWDSQIEQIYVKKGKKGKPTIELIPRVGDHVVYLGTLDNYEKKFRRLKIFYEKGLSTVGWNKYESINLEYDNQIICTKRDKKKHVAAAPAPAPKPAPAATTAESQPQQSQPAAAQTSSNAKQEKKAN